MPIIYLCGTEPGVGKTTLAVGLGRWLRRLGHGVRYVKLTTDAYDPDAIFAAAELGQRPEVAPPGSPFGVPPLAADADEAVLIEGSLEHVAQARLTDLVLLLAPYRGRRTLERIAATGLRPGALVLNAVPEMYVERVREQLVPALQAAGWSVLGVVPQEQLLLGVPVRALVERLRGRWLCGEEHGDRLVARLAIAGGMLQDTLLWLGRRPHHALICKGDRADLPLAALQAGTVAIFLTEGLQPGVQVLAGARERGVPLVSVHQNAIRALEAVEDLFTTPTAHHPQKAAAALALVGQHLALDRLAHVTVAMVGAGLKPAPPQVGSPPPSGAPGPARLGGGR